MIVRLAWVVTTLAILGVPAWADESGSSAAKNDPKTEPPVFAVTGPKPKPITPPTAAEIDQSIHRGIEFLLKTQHKDGFWGSANSTRPGEVTAPIPGAHHAFKAAVTAMCISALIESGRNDPRAVQAVDRAEGWLLENLARVRRATPEVAYNVWTHGYAIQALVRLRGLKKEDAARRQRIDDLIRHQIGMLERYEVISGGWCYYDFGAKTQKPSWSTLSFVTAAVMVALHEAREAGIEVPQKLIDRAADSIRRQRKPDFSVYYGSHHTFKPMGLINRPCGSLGRSQACNIAMRLWGDALVTDDVMKTWLDRLFARQLWLEIGRKRPVPHEAWAKVAGYFFYFGHYYAALCIENLPESERAPFQDQLAKVLLNVQESDGSWWDFPLFDYHKAYGTAFALMSLQRTRKSAASAG